MGDGLYVGMAGATARAEQLDAIADNLANAQTPGYMAQRPAFETFVAASGAQDKAYPAAVATALDRRPGLLQQTGNPLDIALTGDAMLTVQLAPGQVAYTRNGRLQVDAAGQLLAAGHPVVGSSGAPIVVPPNAKVELSETGAVRMDGVVVDELQLNRIEGPLKRIGGALVAPEVGSKVTRTDARVQIGALEGGNYSALEATVDLVGAQRHYEASMQAIDVYRKLADRANDVGRVR